MREMIFAISSGLRRMRGFLPALPPVLAGAAFLLAAGADAVAAGAALADAFFAGRPRFRFGAAAEADRAEPPEEEPVVKAAMSAKEEAVNALMTLAANSEARALICC